MTTFEHDLLEYESKHLKSKTIISLLEDSDRKKALFLTSKEFCLDLSREKITSEIFPIFQKEFDEKLFQKIQDFRNGKFINTTEKRQVLHHLLRDSKNEPLTALSEQMGEVQNCRQRIKVFSDKIRSGEIKAFDQTFENIISIGIGGSYLGVECVYEALKIHNDSLLNNQNLNLFFLSNVDPSSAYELIHTLDLKKTLIVVVSKTFTTQETMQNFNIMIEAYNKVYAPFSISQERIIKEHFCAISTNIVKCKASGISEERIFPLWDWVGGRFSVSSAVGALPISLALSYDIFEQFLDGMREMDSLFFTEKDVKKNIPVLLGMLDFYHNHVEKYSVKIIIPYAQPLHRFPAHIQQLEMESNGKRFSVENQKELNHDVGKFIFGEPGTNSQHSFFQLLHQGRVNPVEFIGFCNPQNERKIVNSLDTYNEFIVNMFAQMDALAVGSNSLDLSKKFTGNRPSFAFLFKNELNAFTTGVLLSIYEHRTAVEGFLEGINSFDQFGVELGKKLFQEIRGFLKTSETQNVQKSNYPCQQLIDYYNQNTNFK